MFLLIDATVKDFIRLALFNHNEVIAQKQHPGKNREILQTVDHFLEEHHCQTDAVSGIVVAVGAGSFTSTRLAVTVANAWGYANQIALITVPATQEYDFLVLAKQLQDTPPGQYISATYSAEANVGQT